MPVRLVAQKPQVSFSRWCHLEILPPVLFFWPDPWPLETWCYRGVSLCSLVPATFLGWNILLLITPISVFIMKYWSNVWYTPMKLKWNHPHHLYPNPCSQKFYETSLMLYSKDALGLLPGERYNPWKVRKRSSNLLPVTCSLSCIQNQRPADI